jgi:hypothetical protein
MADREFKGGAVATTLSGAIDGAAATIAIQSSTGWPTGTGTDTFVAVINRGQADEEKVLCDSRAANVLTVAAGGRGYDGTAAQSHAAAATIEHCVDAVWLQEINQHYTDTTLDHHTQYLTNARHDIAARHTFGAAYPTPAAPPDVTTAANAGAAAGPARSDHTHKIAAGTITNTEVNAAAAIATTKINPDPLARANHTGTQPVSTISPPLVAANITDFNEAAQDAIGNNLLDGTYVDLTYNDAAGTVAADLFAGFRPYKVCTSATRPGTPNNGDLIYETDTKRVMVYDGTAWVPIGPLGALGRAILTVSGAAGSPAIIDVGTMSVPVTVANASRLIRVDAFASLTCGSGGGANASLMIREGSTTLGEAVSTSWLSGPGVVGPFFVSCLLTPTAGAHTYKMSVQFSGNSDNSVTASPSRPAYILVTDEGPA